MYDFSTNDLVTYFGQLVGRAIYVRNDGWAVVEQGNGRQDEYPAALLRRVK